MKKTLMIALLCLPLAMMAQERGKSVTKPGADRGGEMAGEPEMSLTAQVYVKVVNGRESCQIKLGSTPKITYENDKFVMEKIKELTTSRYQSMVDALNALTQLGFEIESSFATVVGNTQEVYIMLTKPGKAGSPRRAVQSEEGGTQNAPATGDRKKKK